MSDPKTEQALMRHTMKPGGRYNWKNQPDRLVYLGRYGGWHQFRKIGDPRDVWCEVLDADLHMLEETRVAPQAAPAPEPECERSRQINMDRDRLWEENGIPSAAPAPEPSAQAVAHPSHQTVREWMPVSEALRLSDLWTAGDLDNCGQWRAAIKVLADEVRALAASPQPEPSAQGEPVARYKRITLCEGCEHCAYSTGGVYRCMLAGKDFAVAGRAHHPPAWCPLPVLAPAVVEAVPLTDAARDVLAERQRQVEKEGWVHDHDDEYEQGELAFAASCYAVANSGATVPPEWPWSPEWWKPRDHRGNLVRAAALLLAEIERLDRAAAAHQEKP